MLMWNLSPGSYKTKGPPPENSKPLNGWATRPESALAYIDIQVHIGIPVS
jgi:hypothetical protein